VPASGTVSLAGYAMSGAYKPVHARTYGVNTATYTELVEVAGVYANLTAPVTGVEFSPSTGNCTGGVIVLKLWRF
jgi:hypothetical protein